VVPMSRRRSSETDDMPVALQDHNGFTHQDPGFLDVLTNKSPEVVRIYLPPDGNTMLSTMDHCFKSKNYVNCIVYDKQPHLQFLNKEEAMTHCAKGLGIWEWASTYPDEVSPCGPVRGFCEFEPVAETLRVNVVGTRHCHVWYW
jgi:xylulose-5-phosphate/fructose-6-phosphate phosphoketolase